jgi:hypothetical protein
MGKNNRREVAKRLTQEIAAATDPETLIRLTTQLTKVLPKRRRTRKPLGEPKKTTTPESTFVKGDYPRGGDFLENLPMGEREFWRLILGVEATSGYRTMTPGEVSAFMGKMKAGFSDAERAALEAYRPPESRNNC